MIGFLQSWADRAAGSLRYLCRVFLMGATLAGVILLSVDLFKYLFQSSDFSIQEITIEGNRRIDRGELLIRAGLMPGANIWLIQLDELSRRIEEHPTVHRVGVQRIPPHRIHIIVEERAPVLFALNPADGALYGIDREGVVLPPVIHASGGYLGTELESAAKFVQSRALVSGAVEIPFKPGAETSDERLLEGIALASALAEAAPSFSADIAEMEFRENGDIALHPHRRAGVVVLRDIDEASLAARLEAFWTVLETHDLHAVYVDARFPEHGFAVRWDERRGMDWKRLYGTPGPLTQAMKMES